MENWLKFQNAEKFPKFHEKVENPTNLSAILDKIDSGDYLSMQSFLNDINKMTDDVITFGQYIRGSGKLASKVIYSKFEIKFWRENSEKGGRFEIWKSDRYDRPKHS